MRLTTSLRSLALLLALYCCPGAHAAGDDRERRTDAQYDLIVVGVGSGGFGAALAGARHGLSVLCIEKADRIGGNVVRCGVSMWEPGVGGTGFPFELYRRLRRIPNAVAVYSFGRHISWSGWKGFPGGEHVVDPKRRYVDTLRRHRSREKAPDNAFRKEVWHGVVFEPRIFLIACRGASFSSLAASSCRLSRTMMQLGQAAGTAVALAEELSVDLPDVPPEKLRAALRAQHVELDWPRTAEIARYVREE